ncbi:PadR family transcriptional regulator [Microlunatus speluncae]|uniref:PadR family transcriptional regulator n=1 Tax=Microlunatus speluncae TaxID=2594267 RepID=UPI00126641A4|nr:PadR family transcriptional regulator [Microlunatus speluncae]
MASAAVTRMLVLGVVSLFQPMNGYQVLRELNSWYVEDWAQVKPGSIYSMLNSLSKQGMLHRHELAEADRAVAVYEVSESGERELGDLVRVGLDGSRGLDPVMFHATMSFAPTLQRAEVIAAVVRRIENVTRYRDGLVSKISNDSMPSHVRHALTLPLAQTEAELAWVTEFRTLLDGGYLWFAGESGDPWEPPPEDAGWEMVAQAQRYQKLIAERRKSGDIQT